MSTIMAAILAALPGIALRIIAPLLTQEFAVVVGRRALVAAARKIAHITATTVDDDLVNEMAARLGVGPE